MPPHNASASRTRPSTKKRQKVDALADLILHDTGIEAEAKILANLRDGIRQQIRDPASRRGLQKTAPLYSRYKGKGFPLRKPNGRKLPAWRNLSPWMKAQLVTLVLAEKGYMQFKLHIHDDTAEEWEARGKDFRDELRNKVSYQLKRHFGKNPPMFFFVIEDRTSGGSDTRPHAHGSIEIIEAELPRKGRGSRSLSKLAASGNSSDIKAARLEAGRQHIRQALIMASGGSEPKIARSGVDQSRNLWSREPYHALFNHQYVDYAFRNVRFVSTTLGESRFAMPNYTRREAERIWKIIRGS